MKLLSIAFKDFLTTLRDKQALALIILMPLALILVLGMGLSSMFSNNGLSIKKFDVAIINEDKGEISKQLEDFFKSEEINKMITLKTFEKSEALNKVQSGELPVLIVVPKDFTDKVNKGESISLQIYNDPASPMRSKIVESLIKSFTDVVASIQSAVEAAEPTFKQYNLNPSMIVPEVLSTIENSSSVEFNPMDLKKENNLTAMQYYSAAMLVMYILFVASIGTTSIIEEREQKTLLRLMSTTVNKGSIIAGKLLGLVFIGILEVIALVLFTHFAFGVNWGNSLIGLILVSASMIFAATGFAMFIATIFKTTKSVQSMSSALIMVLSALGGSMFPIFGMPPLLQTISKLTLNNWALRGYLSLMMNGTDLITPIIVLCAMGITFLTLGITRLKLD